MSYLILALGLTIALIPAGGGLWVIGRMQAQRMSLRHVAEINKLGNAGRWLVGLGLLAISVLIITSAAFGAYQLGQISDTVNQLNSTETYVEPTIPEYVEPVAPVDGPDCSNLDVLDQADYYTCIDG